MTIVEMFIKGTTESCNQVCNQVPIFTTVGKIILITSIVIIPFFILKLMFEYGRSHGPC